ncbi:Ig-like domain-containing protein [Patescibacteria group bacterium]|nr:Ig-like domain-containing protein [Patescibacteria group bacterium]
MEQKKKYVLHSDKQVSKKSLLSRVLYAKIHSAVFWVVGIVLLLGLASLYAFNYSEIHALYPTYTINAENRNTEVEPLDKLYFKFSQPVNEEQVRENFSIKPPIDGDIRFFSHSIKGYAKGFVFEPKGGYKPDTEYTVTIDKLTSFFGTDYTRFAKQFATITSPKIVSIFPENESTGIFVKPDIRIEFDKKSQFFDYVYSLAPKTSLSHVEDFDSTVVLKPETQLAQGTDYQLSIDQQYVVNDHLGKESRSSYHTFDYQFKTVDPVEVLEVSPKNESTRVSPKTEIKIVFNKLVKYDSAEEHFSIDPFVEGEFGWEDKTLIFQPKEELKNPQEYTVTIAPGVASFIDDGFLEDEYTFAFKSERYTKEIIPNEPIIPAITEGKYVDIDISEQLLTIFEDGRSLGSFRTSTGKYSMPTPYGTFKVLNKSPQAYSSKYNLYMPYWMAFTGAGHGIHELPFWKYRGGAEYKERESHLGIRVSHGCVRLGVGPAEIVYNFADVGTPVVVHE